MTKMRSVVRDGYGEPEILRVEEIARPQPKDDEILVRVNATTVNRTDCGALWGKPFIFRFFVGFPKPRHKATGSDFAGVVEEVGPRVTRFKVGDRVFGFDDECIGTHAEYVALNANKAIFTIPDGVSFETAAASIEGAHYAYNFISKVELKPESRVIVNGGTGAIGSAALQILRYRGLEVVAVCGTAHVDRVKSLGAHRVIDFEKEDFTQTEQPLSYDFVFDAVGKSSFGACRRILKARGVYISSELGPRGENPFFAIITPLFGGKKVVFPIPVAISRSIAFSREMLVKRAFTPLIDREYRLEQIGDAFRYVNSGRKIGNVVLKP